MVMQHEDYLAHKVNRHGEASMSMPYSQYGVLRRAAATLAVFLLCVGIAVADDDSTGPRDLRQFIDQQAGGLSALTVPARSEDIPLPKQADGTVNPRYKTTEEKRFLGKMLFHDPVRTARVNINQGQPLDLPAGTAFGGTLNAAAPNIQAIVDATRQTGSCGSCHIGEAAAARPVS